MGYDRGITIRIYGETKGLDAALKKVYRWTRRLLTEERICYNGEKRK